MLGKAYGGCAAPSTALKSNPFLKSGGKYRATIEGPAMRWVQATTLPRPRGDLRWSSFLRLHAQGIIARDFFVAVTATFRLLYVFVVIEHPRSGGPIARLLQTAWQSHVD
jgi:hypothetical protein